MAEADTVVQLLMGIHELLQRNVGWTAANAPKGTPQPKVKKFPRPKTAAQLYAIRQAREAHEFIESHITYVDTATFEAAIAAYGAEVAGQTELKGR